MASNEFNEEEIEPDEAAFEDTDDVEEELAEDSDDVDDDDAVVPDVDADDYVDDDSDEDDEDDDDEQRDEALEELEAEELEIEDDPETILVDEAAEIRAMRREELGLDANSREIKASEFVCSECFLVKSVAQLANKSRKVCRDCV